jgi:hypothetical protein
MPGNLDKTAYDTFIPTQNKPTTINHRYHQLALLQNLIIPHFPFPFPFPSTSPSPSSTKTTKFPSSLFRLSASAESHGWIQFRSGISPSFVLSLAKV